MIAHQPLKESCRCMLISTWLKKNIDNVTVLIDGTPKVLLLAVDSHEEFVQIPAIAQLPSPLLQTFCIVGAELPTPMSNGFVGDGNAALRQEILYIAEAHAETMVDPDGVTNDLRWETMSAITGSGVPHGVSLSVRCLN